MASIVGACAREDELNAEIAKIAEKAKTNNGFLCDLRDLGVDRRVVI
jgi:hypothetical protein